MFILYALREIIIYDVSKGKHFGANFFEYVCIFFMQIRYDVIVQYTNTQYRPIPLQFWCKLKMLAHLIYYLRPGIVCGVKYGTIR